MALSLGISHWGLSSPPAGATAPQYSFSSQRWKLNNFASVSLRVRPNWRARSGVQAHEAESGDGVFARNGASAETVVDGGTLSEEKFEDSVRDVPVGGPNSRGGSPRQVHEREAGEGDLARRALAAAGYGVDGERLSEEDVEDFVRDVPVGRPNPRGRSSRQVHDGEAFEGDLARRALAAAGYGVDGERLSEENVEDVVRDVPVGRPNPRGRSSRQVHDEEAFEGDLARRALAAAGYGVDGRKLSEEDFEDVVRDVPVGRPSPRVRSSRQVHEEEDGEGDLARRALAAAGYGVDGGTLAEEDVEDVVRDIPVGRPNPRGRSSRQVQEAEADEGEFARKALAAAGYGVDGGTLSEEGKVHDVRVGYRGRATAPRVPPQRSNGRIWRRFPGSPQGGSQEDVTVPIEALRRGAVFTGTVRSIQPFGAFVDFGAFADGLIHISKLSTGFVKDVTDVVELGEEVMVSIVNVEEATGRISLALVEKDQVDLRKPYVAPDKEAARHRGERPRIQSGYGRSAFTSGEREERVSNGSYASSSRSMDFREGGEGPRYQSGSGRISHSMPEEKDGFSRNPNASSRQWEGRRGGGQRPRLQPESARISHSMPEGEQQRFSSRNQNASSRQWDARKGGEEWPRFETGSGQRSPLFVEEEKIDWNRMEPGGASEGHRVARTPFASPGRGQSRGEDRQPRNPFASSRQGEVQEEDRASRNLYAPSRRREAGEEGLYSRFQHQGNDGNLRSRGRVSGLGRGVDREERSRPKMKLVQIPSDVKSGEDEVSSRMRNVMSGWYECDCC